MSTALANALQSLSSEEITLTLDAIQKYSTRTKQYVYKVHACEIRKKYEGFARLLNLDPDAAIEVLSPGKTDGYAFAASLIVTVAEKRKSPALQTALLAIDPDEFMKVFCQIIEDEPEKLIANQIASRLLYPGFCFGISGAFAFLDAGGEHCEQMSIGMTIFFGVILELAGHTAPDEMNV